MPNFTGQLRSNEIFGALYNMIISQEVFADNFEGLDDFVSKFRVDGSMYGDTKTYYSADVLHSDPWVQDSQSALNLLATHRPPAPDQQAIVIDQFRQIALTVDNYMSKRAWSDEGTFSNFNSVMLQMIRDTKRIYDYTLVSTFIGTNKAAGAAQDVEVALSEITETGIDKDKKEAMVIAQTIADLMVDIKRPTRKYNDHGNMRAFSKGQLRVIFNSKFANKIRKVDLPTIYNNDGLIDFEDTMPPEYFGEVNTTGGTTTSSNTTVRSLIETDYGNVHVFPGDLLPNSTAYLGGVTYTQDDDVICKIIGKRSVPFMSAFEVGTSFYNERNLSTNHYLTWGYNTLEHLKNYPYITVHAD